MKNKMLTDSMALASVKIFTMASSILSTMILSKTLPLEDYGTYSTGNLIITTSTLISAFGLMDAVNYYYNGKNAKERARYVNTIFFLIILCGGAVGGIILGAQNLLTQYFHNPMLGMIYAYIAFRPFLQNLSLGLQNLQVSIGKAKVVAIKNAVMSVSKLGAIIITSLYTKNILTIFKCMLIVEIISLFFYTKVLRENDVHINPFKPDWTKIKEVLIFCIPLGIYIQTNALSRDLDKYIIGFFESTEKLAIYTNCSTKLPFDLLSGPLVTLLIPLLTRCIQKEDYENGAELFRSYLKIGYISTLSFGFGAILVADQAVQFLYGSKYLDGVSIFVIYIFVDMINFIGYSLVLSARGKTKELMIVSCSALIVNVVINLLLYRVMGFVGPAVATVIITAGVSFILLSKSAVILKKSIRSLFDLKHIFIFGIEILILSCGFNLIKRYMESLGLHYIIILIVIGATYVTTLLLLNLKEIKKCFVILNNIDKKKKRLHNV